MQRNILVMAEHCLAVCDVEEKLTQTHVAAAAWRSGEVSFESDDEPAAIGEPGRPPRPVLVPPRDLVQRNLKQSVGRAALLHAIAHIEFNAINLAWDAVYRFRGLPKDYYDDWVRVADEEAQHFALLAARLCDLGYAYGDFPAHNSLWEMARKTAHDPLLRMALVPRVLEARGLDVTPAMMERLRQVGDLESVALLEIILREEIGHVAIGSRWFRYLCQQRGLAPANTFLSLVQKHLKSPIKQPIQHELRKSAGFEMSELAGLEDLEGSLSNK